MCVCVVVRGGGLSSLLSCPLFFSPGSDLPELHREGQERKGTCLHVRFTRTQRGKKSNCSDMHACAHTRMSACLPAHPLAHTHTPHLIQRGITMGMCEKTEWLRSCEGTSLTLVQLRFQSPTKFYKKTGEKVSTELLCCRLG